MNNFEQEYKNAMNDVHASDDLRNRIMNIKPARRTVTPFKSAIATVAAAVMILVVANDYDFTPNTEGVITETVVSTQMPLEDTVATVTEAPVRVEKAKQKTVSPKTEAVVAVTTEEPVAEETDNAPAIARYGMEDIATEVWEINRYFEYIGADVHSKVNGSYIGDNEFEFVIDENGDPVQDTVMLAYVTADGGNINIMISKTPIFDAGLSGNVVEGENGHTGYKTTNGVYYQVSASGITCDGMIELINNL